ncbi:MAG: hypothetical protein FWG64_11200 [Firmicutes bacterium]|nr:hypothetical protein [Bacillota bacterium]
MILMALILGAVLAVGVAVFWKSIVNWIKKAVDKIKQVLGVVVQGTRTFIAKTVDGFRNKSVYYNENKLSGEWEETIYYKKANPSEIPEDILAKVSKQKIDIEVSTTEELRLVITA